VYDENNNALSGVLVTAHYPPGYSLTEESTLTNTFGYYYLDAYVGSYLVSFKKANYFTEGFNVNLDYNESIVLNATLKEGSCNEACANWENRCNPQCEGRVFQTGSCNYYDNATKDLCADKEVGTWVLYNSSGDVFTYVQCCEGAPFDVVKPQALISGEIEDLYKKVKLVKDQRTKQPVKLVINVWLE